MRVDTTSNAEEEAASEDEKILDYLSKKALTDQTEQLAIARISSKIQTSAEQTEKALERLRAKDWVRKYKLPGKVTFELTTKGKLAIEANDKARRERITSQLQQAIQQQRKAKLRTNALDRMESIEDNWRSYHVPEKTQMDNVESEAAWILSQTKDAQAKQPMCEANPKGYEQEFQQYKTQIENLTVKNNHIYKAANNYTQVRSALFSISADIEKINKTISRYQAEPEASIQIDKLRASINQLRMTQSQLEAFGTDQLSRLEELKIKLAENSKILETLKKPTHEFSIIKKESTEKTSMYPDPELPIICDHQTSRVQLQEKCIKCGMRRRSTPVNIG